eukprot:scaffold29854_cov57-Phaeocystis_antarctica.AAC.2
MRSPQHGHHSVSAAGGKVRLADVTCQRIVTLLDVSSAANASALPSSARVTGSTLAALDASCVISGSSSRASGNASSGLLTTAASG